MSAHSCPGCLHIAPSNQLQSQRGESEVDKIHPVTQQPISKSSLMRSQLCTCCAIQLEERYKSRSLLLNSHTSLSLCKKTTLGYLTHISHTQACTHQCSSQNYRVKYSREKKWLTMNWIPTTIHKKPHNCAKMHMFFANLFVALSVCIYFCWELALDV